MKSKASFLKLAACVCLFVAESARADFDITFSTGNAFVSNPVFDIDGTTRLAGSAYKAQLYVGANAGSLVALGSGGLSLTASAGDTTGIRSFLSGGGAGFINGGTLTVTSGTLSANSSAVYQLRVWEAAYASFEAASAIVGAKIGSSAVTSVTLGGTVPGIPPTVVTLQANQHGAFALTTVAVPEPATIALGLFGAAGLLVRRRK